MAGWEMFMMQTNAQARGTASSAPGRPAPGYLGKWQAQMACSVNALQQGDFQCALGHLMQAGILAKAILSDPSRRISDDDRVAAYVVTHLNLADVSVQENYGELALDYLCRAYRALATLIADQQAAISLRQSAFRHIRELRAALARFSAGHADQARLAELTERYPVRWPEAGS